MPAAPDTRTTISSEKIWCRALLAASIANYLFQLAWFWRFRARNITTDGIGYIGLARHLVDGDFRASLHGYWSPLTSWIIAASALFSRNFTLLGRLTTILSFLICLPLLYLLTNALWRSRVAAALSVFWFTTARGLAEESIGSILGDFWLTACVLLYFWLLLKALRENRAGGWLTLGAVHGVAFLAKAFALPWLSIATAVAALCRNWRSPRRLASSAVLAFVFPAIIWASWGTVLRTKYGVFTAGYQLRANLAVNWHRHLTHHPRGDALEFIDHSQTYDNYMVGETSWSALQSFHPPKMEMVGVILASERLNLPAAFKELSILLGPAGILALPAVFFLLVRERKERASEFAFAIVTFVSTVTLVLAYCMLVFDARYVIPIATVLIALCCSLPVAPNLAPSAPHVPAWLQRTLLALFAAGIVFFSFYWASPYRTVDRDFEESCYQAADVLRGEKPGGTLVSLGNGPYPEHGVGFEVGSYVAYLGGWRLVGGNSGLPDSSSQTDELAQKALAMNADAIAVWGNSSDPAYTRVVARMLSAAGLKNVHRLTDPAKGEAGTLLLFTKTVGDR